MEETNESPVEKTPLAKSTEKAKRIMRTGHGVSILASISFIESFLPLPILTEPFLVAAILLDRVRVKTMVLVTTISSVVGGTAAYLLAAHYKDSLFTLMTPDMAETLNSILSSGQDTFFLTIIGAFTPIPYTIVAWAVALSGGNIWIFIIGSIVGRSIRYSIVGWCTYVFGPTAMKYAQRSIFLTSIVIFVLAAVYIWLKM